MKLRYKGPYSAVNVPSAEGGLFVKYNEEVEVSDPAIAQGMLGAGFEVVGSAPPPPPPPPASEDEE